MPEDGLLSAILNRAGLSPKDVTLINVNFSLSPSLISGQVDAVIGAFRNFELNQMDIVNRPGRAFYGEEEGVPAYDELIIKDRQNLDDKLNKRAFRDTLPRFALRPAALDHGRYSRMAHFLKDQGLIKTVPMINDYAVELK